MTTMSDQEAVFRGMHARARILEAENVILRGVLAENNICVYGHIDKGETIAQCKLGFPGCACADDLYEYKYKSDPNFGPTEIKTDKGVDHP